MKKVSVTDIKKASRWALPVGVVAIGLVAVVAAQSGTGGSKAAVTGSTSNMVQSQSSESPAAAKPDVTVNGTKIPTDKNGTSSVDIPGGKAQVEVSGGQTRITTHQGSASGDTSNKTSGNVNINTNSQSNGGTNWGSTQVYGFSSSSDNGSSSTNSTQIFSTGSDHVNISQ